MEQRDIRELIGYDFKIRYEPEITNLDAISRCLSLTQMELWTMVLHNQVRWAHLQREVEGDAVLNQICDDLKLNIWSHSGYHLEHRLL